MKKIILVIMILFVQVSFAQKYIIKDKVDTLSLKVPSALPTEVGQVPMYFTQGMSFEKVYTQDQVDNKEQNVLSLVNRDYASKTSYEELSNLIRALQDSITALRNSIGIITPTFPDVPTGLIATGRTTDIMVKWDSAAVDSYAVFYSPTNPATGEGNWYTLDYIAEGAGDDTVYYHTGISSNTVFYYHVKSVIGGVFSNASQIDSAFIYEAPTVNNWKYVSLNGDGDRSGIDSANAFSIGAISGLVAGDTLVFLGGTYTTGLTVNFSGTANNLITLMPSYTNGVTFSNITTAFYTTNSYLKIKGFNFNACGTAVIIRNGGNVIYLEGLTSTKQRGAKGIEINGYNASGLLTIDSVFIVDCNLAADSQINTQTDVIEIKNADNIFIDGNIIRQENIVGTQHNDAIQTIAPMGNITVVNNKISQVKADDSQGGMTHTPIDGKRYIIYNNAIHSTGNGTPLWSYEGSYPSMGRVYLIHNTFYNSGAVSGGYINQAAVLVADSIYCKNNVLVSGGVGAINLDTAKTNYFDSDYNLFYSSDVRYPIVLNGYGKTLAYWQAYWLGQDANSINSNPLFTSTSNSYTGLTLQALSPAKNAGTNLQALIESFGLEWKTIEGTVRDATPDLGAY